MRLALRPLAVLALSLATSSLLAAPLAPAAAAAAAEPSSGPCVSFDPASPTCQFEYGTVTFVADGDTLDVKIDTSPVAADVGVTARVRLSGVQAMELDTYSRDADQRSGPCHGVEATASLESMTPIGRRVRLAAQDLHGRSGERFRRSVAFVDRDGLWQDVATQQLQRGMGLWLPNTVENAWNRHYNYWSQKAAASGLRLWDTDACGLGPAQAAELQMYVRSDAEGTDGDDLNGEYVRIHNRSTERSVDLSGWFVRDTMLRPMTATAGVSGTRHPGFTFPSGTVVAPGDTVTLHVGSGTSSARRFYWQQTSPVFENQTAAPAYVGDGAYLFDPQGDLRVWQVYGCLTRSLCADPLAGRVRISQVQWDAPGTDSANPNGEYVDVTAGDTPVDLQGYQLVNFPYAYDFGAGSVLQPGERLRVHVGAGSSSRLVRYWGKSAGIFNNAGETVSLENFRGSRLSCAAWGSGRC